ncbi:RAD55 family ATPase [Halobacteriales archaeon Cl-PHB]
MERLPFGISRLDKVIDGGAPPGSVVLLSGEAGAGAREFMYTSAVMNSLANEGHDLFDLHYGDLPDRSSLPDEVHYLSFTADADQLGEEMGMAMDDEIAEPGLEGIDFQSLSRQYFHVSPVPRDWYASEAPDIKNLRKRHEEREGLLSALGRELSRRAPGNLVVIDSLSDLAGALGEDIDWSDVTYIVRGMQKAAYEWGGLILLHVNHDTLSDTQLGQLVDACNGTMTFNWETGGSTRARTLVVQQFRGVLSQIEEENIVTFETDLSDSGFDISDVRKIR